MRGRRDKATGLKLGFLRPVRLPARAPDRDNEGTQSVLNTLQTERGIRIDVDRSRDRLLTDFGKATLDEVALPARYRIGDGDDPEEDFAPIPNLRVLPSSPAMAGADLAIAERTRVPDPVCEPSCCGASAT